jgi:hypothetical protein
MKDTKPAFIHLKDLEACKLYNQSPSSSSEMKSNFNENVKINQIQNDILPMRAIDPECNCFHFLAKQNKDLQDLKNKKYNFEIQKYSEFYFLHSLLLEMKNFENNLKNKGFFKSKSKIRKTFVNLISDKIRGYIPIYCSSKM